MVSALESWVYSKVSAVHSCSICYRTDCPTKMRTGFCLVISTKNGYKVENGAIALSERYANDATENWVYTEIQLFGAPQ